MNITIVYNLHELEIIYKSYFIDQIIVQLGLGLKRVNLKLIKLNNILRFFVVMCNEYRFLMIKIPVMNG
jgi:hypothetical protein